MEDDMRKEKEKFVAGCKTVDNKTLINNSVSEDVKQRLKSEEIKLLGNEEFKAGNYNRAEEYYTSAILQFDKVSTLKTPQKDKGNIGKILCDTEQFVTVVIEFHAII